MTPREALKLPSTASLFHTFHRVLSSIATDRDDIDFRYFVVALNESTSWQERECTYYDEPHPVVVPVPPLSSHTSVPSGYVDPAEAQLEVESCGGEA